MSQVYIGRQPIFDRHLSVYAYELLYRPGETTGSGDQGVEFDGESATATVLVNALLEIGLDRLVGDRLAFVNMTRGFLLRSDGLPLPPKRVTLEILEDVEVDDTLVEAVRQLSEQGFEIALDDFVLTPQVMPLVELADLIKIDYMHTDRSRLPAQLAFLRRFNVRLLAEKVETQEEYEQCRQLGFDYFQGYFLCRPNLVNTQRLPDNHLATMRLLAELQSPDTNLQRLEQLVTQNVGLSYKLLRYVNSASLGIRRRVTAIHDAIVLLGLATIRSLTTLMTLSAVENKPSELIRISMVRARTAEQLAPKLGIEPSMLFTVGLFSVLDALMDAPFDQLLDPLPLHDDVKDALLSGSGPAGAVLQGIIEYEQGLDPRQLPLEIPQDTLAEAYVEAIAWADECYRSVCEPAA